MNWAKGWRRMWAILREAGDREKKMQHQIECYRRDNLNLKKTLNYANDQFDMWNEKVGGNMTEWERDAEEDAEEDAEPGVPGRDAGA